MYPNWLAAAYGVAVTATMITTSLMAFFVFWKRWNWPIWQAAALIVPLLLIEQVFCGQRHKDLRGCMDTVGHRPMSAARCS